MFITGRPGILKSLIRGFDQAKYEYPPIRITSEIYQVFFQAEKTPPSQVKVMLPQLRVLSLLPTKSGLGVLVEIWKVTQAKNKNKNKNNIMQEIQATTKHNFKNYFIDSRKFTRKGGQL